MTRRRPTLAFSAIIFSLVAVLYGVQYWLTHRTLGPPPDTPKDAAFIFTGTDFAHLHARGEWISCHLDTRLKADACRITNESGTTIFEGLFLPVGKTQPAPDTRLHVATFNPAKQWVHGPIEHFPIPVIPLTDGTILVPADDAKPLADLWKTDTHDLDGLLTPPAK
jgi:hypothetical protein